MQIKLILVYQKGIQPFVTVDTAMQISVRHLIRAVMWVLWVEPIIVILSPLLSIFPVPFVLLYKWEERVQA